MPRSANPVATQPRELEAPVPTAPETLLLPNSGVSKSSAELPVIAAFEVWQIRYFEASATEQANLLAEGLALAKARRPVMLDLIKINPADAIAQAVPREVYNKLPELILQELETPLAALAELALIQTCFHPEGAPAGHSHDTYRATVIDGQEYRAHVYGSRLIQASIPETSLYGYALDGHLAVADARVRFISEGEPLPAEIEQAVQAGGIAVEANGAYYVFESEQAAIDFATELQVTERRPVTNAADSGSGSSGVSGRPSQAWTHGDKSLLVILVDFSDVPGAPVNKSGSVEITPSVMNTVINGSGEVRSFLQNSSFGKTDVLFDSSTDVTGVLRMPNTASSYATADAATLLHSDARDAADAAGYSTSNYDRVAVVFSSLSSLTDSQFTFAGLANITGSNIWINGYFDFRVMAHELGHTYGLRHSNLWQVSGSDPVDLAGSSTEYGDPFDLMGDGDFVENDFSHWNKSLLQWIPDTAVLVVTSDETVRVYRFDDSGADLNLTRAVKVVRDPTRDFWIGYRRGLSSSATNNGAYVLWGYNTLTQGNLLDLNTPSSDPSDAPLALGSSFNDSAAGITISVIAQGGSGAEEWLDLSIAFQPRLQWSALSYVANEQGGSATIAVTRSNNSSGAVSVNYATAGGTASSGTDFTASSGTLNWANGDSEPKQITIPLVADANVEGTETFTVSLNTPSGGVIVPPEDATVTIADPGAADPELTADIINSAVYSVVPLPDGKLLIGGAFSLLQDSAYEVYAYGRIARLNADGSVDTTFDPGTGANGTIRSVALLPDGKILIAGNFTEFDGTTRNRIARLQSNGELDTTFAAGTGANGTIYAILPLPNGKLIIGGAFTSYDSTAREYLAQLDANGVLDTDFVGPDFASTSGWRVESLAMQADGAILVGGVFYFSGGATFRSGLCRIDDTGSLDASFNGITNGAHLAGSTGSLETVKQIEVQPDGKILIGGSFTAYNNTTRTGIARLDSDGSLDGSFNPSLNDSVNALCLLPDGTILIGGNFTSVGATTTTRIAKLDSIGNVDTAFAAAGGHASYVLNFALQPDGNVLLCGDVDFFQGSSVERPIWRFVPGLAGAQGSIEFASESASVVEGTTATLTLTRTGGTLGELTIGYATVAGSATAASDYTANSSTLTWSDGDASSKTINIAITSDIIADTPENFLVNLGAPQIGGALLGERKQATLTIETAFNNWKQQYFSSAELADALISGDTADPDSDGNGNLAEFAFNSNPTVADTDELPVVAIQNISGSDYLTITFTRRTPALDLEYTVESESDLSGAWAGSAVQVGDPTDNLDGTETVTYRDSEIISPSAPKRFLRVSVTRTP